MSHKTCEICGFKSKNENGVKRIFISRFPLDPVRCKKWVRVTGKEDLAYVPIEKLHQLKFVCKNHFLARDFNKSKTRLKRNAVPSINLTAKPLLEETLMDFPCYLFKEPMSEQVTTFNSEIKDKDTLINNNVIVSEYEVPEVDHTIEVRSNESCIPKKGPAEVSPRSCRTALCTSLSRKVVISRRRASAAPAAPASSRGEPARNTDSKWAAKAPVAPASVYSDSHN